MAKVKRHCLAAQQRARRRVVSGDASRVEVTKGSRDPKKRLYTGVIRWEPEAVIRLEEPTGFMKKHGGEKD
jgi:hypothetical protein